MPPAGSMGRDRLAVLELDLVHVPGTAGRAAAQRVDGELQLVTGLERLVVPTVAGERARAAAFEVPALDGAVLVLDIEDDEGVRARVSEILHDAGDFHRMFLVEHGEGVVSHDCAAGEDERATHEQQGQMRFHAFPHG